MNETVFESINFNIRFHRR